MENNYSNYDMLDKMIANNKKAKSWTAIWAVILCLMAAAVLWLADSLSEKNKKINEQVLVIQSNQFNLEVKSRIIDSLTENCNDAKAEIVKSCDSVISETQNTLSSIVNISTQSGAPIQITVKQQEKLKEANKSISKIKTELYYLKTDIKKNSTRLFVQFNNNDDAARLNRFLDLLKSKSDYVVLPPEFIDQPFSTVIKFYNYQNADEEKILKNLLTKYFDISEKRIAIKYEKNKKIKPTVEVWIGTKLRITDPVELKKPPVMELKNTPPVELKNTTPVELKKPTPVELKNTTPVELKKTTPVELKKTSQEIILKKNN